ncbi:3-hydroxyisobutyryl-CoA hydrolase 1-like protein isoform X1 [Cinnamomum micranthum f. kanehirae]|uniref:3-hydroxyisobutyryl-CoA hydrolase n=1 Tax=Cinnamomum micranthum f. kanehirae TaxID=337451 RepID=A0A443NQ11_9MAGN|nr:3-hydroxyisobutyryl-CoA hydrolase 1-like protein isoform X1 [Cinnamomum micranthum f. kanehirae]
MILTQNSTMASRNLTNGDNDQVLIQENSYVRILTLNRPQQLNALSFQMGKGRAFCAGGDVVSMIHFGQNVHWSFGAKLSWFEYSVDYLMATYSKPQVSILNGIVMGGGAGVSIHGRFRVATENTVFAMPEAALGLFPDVGASHFLSRLPGEYVGLTGARLDGAEMLTCGLATHFVNSNRLPLLEEALVEVDTVDPAVVCAIIDRYSQEVPLKEKSAYHKLDIINRCFSKRTVEEILSSLEQEAVDGADEWITETIQSLKKASPIGLKLTLRSFREGRLQTIEECFIRDYRMCSHAMKRDISNDFYEGCRAMLIDKDKNPKWEPSKLELISDEMVDRYFSKIDGEGWVDLKLPVRYKSTISIMSKL